MLFRRLDIIMPATEFGSNMGLLAIIKAIKGQLIASAIFAFYTSILTRHDLVVAAEYTLCKNEFKERSHKRSLATWFFLSNFKDVIPKSMYVWYYLQLMTWPIFCTILFVMTSRGVAKEGIRAAWDLYALVVLVPSFIYWLFFVKREGNGNLVPRFIPRRHVMTQKHTQQKKGKKHTQRKNRK